MGSALCPLATRRQECLFIYFFYHLFHFGSVTSQGQQLRKEKRGVSAMSSHLTPPGVKHTFCILLSGCPAEPISCSSEVLYGMLVSITTWVCYDACVRKISLLLRVKGVCILENQICTSLKGVQPAKARYSTWVLCPQHQEAVKYRESA